MTHIEIDETSTAEYAFTYKLYKGFTYKFVEKDDPSTPALFKILNQTAAIKTFKSKDKKMIQQTFNIKGTIFNCIWTNVNSSKTLLDLPDIISWAAPMVPPTTPIQPELF